MSHGKLAQRQRRQQSSSAAAGERVSALRAGHGYPLAVVVGRALHLVGDADLDTARRVALDEFVVELLEVVVLERLRRAERTNYALSVHLHRASPGGMPDNRPPDVY